MSAPAREYRSPLSGHRLVADTPHSLVPEGLAGGERWPVVDGIPFLRTDSEGLVALALHHLDAGRPDEALIALLTDQDAWWTGPATDLGELRQLVDGRDTLTLRQAMALLRLGPVADYFAYRWSDPTYLGGLALLEAHWQEPRTAFELACGIGHYLRELTRRGVACLGADVVFAKCWLSKHWVAPDADYVVFDAASPWPVVGQTFDLVQCHDAFYFLPDQERMANKLRNAVAPEGVLAISHVHNSVFRDGAKGPARPGTEWAGVFPDARVYDENGLLRALLEDSTPTPVEWSDDRDIEAFSLVEGATGSARALAGGLAMPVPGARLRPNPLLDDGPGPAAALWPSARYAAEYGAGCYWAYADDELDERVRRDPARLRRLVDLPERW